MSPASLLVFLKSLNKVSIWTNILTHHKSWTTTSRLKAEVDTERKIREESFTHRINSKKKSNILINNNSIPVNQPKLSINNQLRKVIKWTLPIPRVRVSCSLFLRRRRPPSNLWDLKARLKKSVTESVSLLKAIYKETTTGSERHCPKQQTCQVCWAPHWKA